MPNDRDFGIIRRKFRKDDRYYTLDDVVDVIMTPSKVPDKFLVVKLGFDAFIYFSSWWPEYFKKTCLNDASYGKDIPKTKKGTLPYQNTGL